MPSPNYHRVRNVQRLIWFIGMRLESSKASFSNGSIELVGDEKRQKIVSHRIDFKGNRSVMLVFRNGFETYYSAGLDKFSFPSYRATHFLDFPHVIISRQLNGNFMKSFCGVPFAAGIYVCLIPFQFSRLIVAGCQSHSCGGLPFSLCLDCELPRYAIYERWTTKPMPCWLCHSDFRLTRKNCEQSGRNFRLETVK